FANLPELGSPVALQGLTSFNQTVALTDDPTPGNEQAFPGQANVWDIDNSFSLNDGGDDQWDGTTLTVGGTEFPSDQAYTEITFSTPIFTLRSEGVIIAAVTGSAFAAPIAGTSTAYLNSLSDARL